MFRHALMRDCAYEMQPPSERARLHALLLEVTQNALGKTDLELEPVAAELADHARAARGAKPTGHITEQFVRESELRFLLLAQRKAMRDHNLELAVTLATRAMEFDTAPPADRAEAARRLALAHRIAMRYEPALEAARQAQQLGAGTSAEGPVWQELAAILSCMNRLDESEQAGQRALQLARETADQRLEAAAMASQGSLFRIGGRTEEARIILERAVEVARAAAAPDVEGIARIHLGYVLGMDGKAQKAREHLAAALRLLEGTERTVNRVDALNYLFDQAFSQGQMAVAVKYLQQAETIARDLGYRVGLAQSFVFRAMLHDSRDEPQPALDALEQAAAISRELGDDRNLAVALANRGNLLLQTGHFEKAEAAFHEGGEVAARAGNAYAQAHAHAGIARVRDAQSRPLDAWQCYEHAIALMEHAGLRREVLKLQRKLAEAQHKAGDTAAARRTLMQAASSAVTQGDLVEQQAAQQQLADLKG